jgi:hypothetical protein
MLRPFALLALLGGILGTVLECHAQQPEPQAVALFDGKTLEGWKASVDGKDCFRVVDGVLEVRGGRGHLFYVGPDGQASFRNFEFTAQVRTYPKANSGIYFHTAYQANGWPSAGYESQVNASHQDRRKTGGLYAVADVMDTSPAPDGEWFSYRIRVEGKRVRIWINDKPSTDFTEPEGWKPPAGMEGRRLGAGTFALQAHDPGCKVDYREIRVLRLP